jgi:tetratricopeptide (TPR) repeat protein
MSDEMGGKVMMKTTTHLVVNMVTILVMGLCTVSLSARSAELSQSVRDAVLAGRNLTPEQVASLEEKLAADPSDVTARTQLLGYYGGVRSIRDQSAKESKRQHVLWFIRNSPESEILGMPSARIHHLLDRDGYAEAKEAWMSQIDREPENATLLGHAAHFFIFGGRRTSIKLLERAQSLDPSNPEWPRKLGHILSLGARGPGGGNIEIAERALEHFERAYELADESLRDPLLEGLAKGAYSADRLDKARHYAELMLQNSEAGWNYGNRVHHGNLVLGRIALREGNIEEAKSRLIAAGNTPGSPQLNSFGPNMALAKALLEIGEREVVLEYFKLCSTFWSSDRAKDKLDKWGELAAAGRIPDFRANLNY